MLQMITDWRCAANSSGVSLALFFAASASFLAASMLIFALAWVKSPAEAKN